ncbi:hydantoinase B/oxoprolinase family protein, partial [Caulobacter sp. S45]|uniref:hydantoinase B/oxoprolinase family protein n=1 Tax=Caulobacter sp. S45 TaxID=1641861 RepID=UPI001575034D
AGGIVGMVRTAADAGIERVLGFDMGGTSTDVSHYAGEYERTFDTEVAGVRMRAPMMRIHTVAAGGGSICRFDGARLRVGPPSAGADPGPACYRRGGPLTVTDCNLMLGRLQPETFPKVFGLAGDQPLDVEVVRAAFAALAAEVSRATGRQYTSEAVAEGFLTIAVDNMAAAIRQVSVQRGYDVEGYTLACFGGAAGQHACRVAEAIGVRQVMIHPLAGVLSAYGMGQAEVRVLREASVEQRLAPGSAAELEARIDALAETARAEVVAQGVDPVSVSTLRRAHLKYEGTDSALPVPFGDTAKMRADFDTAHRLRFGFVVPDKPVVVEALSVEAAGGAPGAEGSAMPPTEGDAAPLMIAQMWSAGGATPTPVFDRATLPVAWRRAGPVIIIDPSQTAVVEPGWAAEVDGRGNLMLTADTPHGSPPSLMEEGSQVEGPDPVRLELFNTLFMAVAEQMGSALQNTAHSVNIKERLDFSCAIFDATGALIANAPHIPVHLGSMGEGVRTIISSRGEGRDGRGMRAGDAYMLNAPYRGGTHLPDVTVIMPVFADEAAGAPAYFVAARGHHGDIGGITPGSMPPQSTSVEQEGVMIDDVLLADADGFKEAEVRSLLGSGPWPARNIEQNLGDLKAELAACVRGAGELQAMVQRHGRAVVDAYMGHVQDNAEAAVREAITRLKDGRCAYEMDNGAVVAVRVAVDHSACSVTVDFTGTSAQLPDNFNAPLSICRAAVLYVFRTLVDGDMPLNDGCMRPITLVAPQGSLLNPRYPAAVVAGNVETSQVITDTLYGALGVQAAAQGTMNNFTFGDERRQYYETICGGSGAGPGYDGADAVQTHMTNSRLTDPEVLEHRFPVVLERFAVRRGSGGAGAHRGGDGVTRRVRFTAPMTAAILANRRRVPPFGADGGEPGGLGAARVERAGEVVEVLASAEVVQVEAGDAFVIDTPGGGGYGMLKA